MNLRSALTLTTAAAAALLLAGCNRQPEGWTAGRDTAICTDRDGRRVSDDRCQRQGAYSSGGVGSNAFLWYYLGRGSAVPYYGDTARGGGFTRTAGATYFHAPVGSTMTRSAAISRGGFGSSAHSFGVGE